MIETRRDEATLKITRALKWLEARRQDVADQIAGLTLKLWAHASDDPSFDRYRLSECRLQLDQFNTLIAQHKQQLRKHRRVHVEAVASDPAPVVYAVPRHDVFTVKVLEALPECSDHSLMTQISCRAESLQAWNYQCLGMRNRRPSRRYEGFQARRALYE